MKQYPMIDTADGALLPMRLAVRRRGAEMHAYLTDGPTLRGAIWLGSIHKSIHATHPAVGQAWEACMTYAATEVLRHFGAREVHWIEPPAPPPTHLAAAG